ncbi:MAG: hypothetical protein EHM70_26435, partial [Chloroflexota bacterium]
RQGDPGSSRFYLSLQDELMRRFGGQQVNDIMQRLKVDEAMPIEMGIVSRLVEQSQTRVEGANFDIRKHLLEYDDVLNTQRSAIYAQRDRIFTKEDLSEDVTEMLRTEVIQRVPKALEAEEGPWELLAWLDKVQPSLNVGRYIFPSYTLHLLLEQVQEQQSDPEGKSVDIVPLLKVAENSLKAEEEHQIRAVNALIDLYQDRLQSIKAERRDAVETFFEGLRDADETDTRTPRELNDELAALTHLPSLRLAPEQQRQFRSDPEEVMPLVIDQVDAALNSQVVTRLVGAVERRLGESLELNHAQVNAADWDQLADQIYTASLATLSKRRERLLGNGAEAKDGQIARDLENALSREKEPLTEKDRLAILQAVRAEVMKPGSAPGAAELQRALQAVRAALSKVEGSLAEEEKEELIDLLEAHLTQSKLQPDRSIQTVEDELAQIEARHRRDLLIRLLLMMPMCTR